MRNEVLFKWNSELKGNYHHQRVDKLVLIDVGKVSRNWPSHYCFFLYLTQKVLFSTIDKRLWFIVPWISTGLINKFNKCLLNFCSA